MHAFKNDGGTPSPLISQARQCLEDLEKKNTYARLSVRRLRVENVLSIRGLVFARR